MTKSQMRKPLMFLAGILLSALLILGIPILNILIKGEFVQKKESKKTAVAIKNVSVSKSKPKPKKKIRRPKRTKAKKRKVASTPRFAMDLGLAGLGGAAVPAGVLSSNPKGRLGSLGGYGGVAGDVDQKPRMESSPSFDLPREIRESETNAYVVLSFCVNVQGKVYDLKVLDESPKGKGLAQAGKMALLNTPFAPAMLGGNPVGFCGMELPFEVRFNE